MEGRERAACGPCDQDNSRSRSSERSGRGPPSLTYRACSTGDPPRDFMAQAVAGEAATAPSSSAAASSPSNREVPSARRARSRRDLLEPPARAAEVAREAERRHSPRARSVAEGSSAAVVPPRRHDVVQAARQSGVVGQGHLQIRHSTKARGSGGRGFRPMPASVIAAPALGRARCGFADAVLRDVEQLCRFRHHGGHLGDRQAPARRSARTATFPAAPAWAAYWGTCRPVQSSSRTKP